MIAFFQKDLYGNFNMVDYKMSFKYPATITTTELNNIVSKLKQELSPKTTITVFLIVLSFCLYFLSFFVASWHISLLVLAIPIFSIATNNISIVIHECAHLSLFKNSKVNTMLGFLSGLLAWTPFFSYKRGHQAHHTWVGSQQKKDPTPSPHKNWSPNFFLNILFKIRILPVFYWFGVYLPYLFYDIVPTAQKRKWTHILQYFSNIVLIVFTHVGLAWYFGHIYFWVAIPGFIGWGIIYEHLFTMTQHIGLRAVPEHKNKYTYREQMNFSRSVEIPFSILLFYFGLHKEHHLIPGINYQYLPYIHKEIQKIRPEIYHYTNDKVEIFEQRKRPVHQVLSPHPGDFCEPL